MLLKLGGVINEAKDVNCPVWGLFTGANVHATTGTGDTALTYACENGHTDVAEALLEHGAELVNVF